MIYFFSKLDGEELMGTWRTEREGLETKRDIKQEARGLSIRVGVFLH
jgi:hypothetical protein